MDTNFGFQIDLEQTISRERIELSKPPIVYPALLKESGSDCYIVADDAPALTVFLRLVAFKYHTLSTETFEPDLERIRRYERRALTEELADAPESVLVPR